MPCADAESFQRISYTISFPSMSIGILEFPALKAVFRVRKAGKNHYLPFPVSFPSNTFHLG